MPDEPAATSTAPLANTTVFGKLTGPGETYVVIGKNFAMGVPSKVANKE